MGEIRFVGPGKTRISLSGVQEIEFIYLEKKYSEISVDWDELWL